LDFGGAAMFLVFEKSHQVAILWISLGSNILDSDFQSILRAWVQRLCDIDIGVFEGDSHDRYTS